MIKRILITGSRGFVGRHFVGRLKQEPNFESFGCDLIDGYDVLKPETLLRLSKVDMVVHLAAKSYIPAAFQFPGDTYKLNVVGVLNMLEYCRINKISKFIFISSYVYGRPEYLPIDEKHPLSATNPYNRSKILGEALCKGYSQDYGITIGIVRPFNLYGQGQDERFIIPTIVNQYLSENDSIIVENFAPKRDYLYINDFVEFLLKLCQQEWKSLKIFNAGFGTSHSVKEVIDNILENGDRTKKVIEKGDIRQGEIMDTIADISLAKRELGWEPKYTLRDGLREILEARL